MSASTPSRFRDPSPVRRQSRDERPTFPIEDADRCVKCALCLPHCPTYRLSQDESESPRGRIALMQGLAEGELEYSERLAGHLDRCLGCRNCEPVCPADVPYGRLIDAGRRLLEEAGRRSPAERRAAAVMASPPWLALFTALGRLYQRSGLQRLARATVLRAMPSLARLDRLLPPIPKQRRRRDAGPAEGREVQLFLGCLAERLDPGVSDAAIQLLTGLGYHVALPDGQGCCSAPDQHGGRPEAAARLSRRNLAAFDGQAPIIGTASGCTATLMEYDEIGGDDPHRRFAQRIRDIGAFLDAADFGAAGIDFRSLPGRALLHLPCSQRNVVGHGDALERLLARIPGLDLHVLNGRGQCCGAAGTYLMSQPTNSDQLGGELAERVVAERPDYVLTSNIGCKLQLRAQLGKRLPHCKIWHPVELLARQMERPAAT